MIGGVGMKHFEDCRLETSPFASIDKDLNGMGDKFDPKSLASNPFAFPVGI